jgi:hypothetical protein
MSPDTDRIIVPTNGKRPHPLPQAAAPEPAAPESLTVAPTSPFTPTQLAVGFGILAAVLALVVGSLRRRGRAGRRGPFGRR